LYFKLYHDPFLPHPIQFLPHETPYTILRCVPKLLAVSFKKKHAYIVREPFEDWAG
jgi:hypothetical protein